MCFEAVHSSLNSPRQHPKRYARLHSSADLCFCPESQVNRACGDSLFLLYQNAQKVHSCGLSAGFSIASR
ncbi:hypothetical protein EMIT0P218_70151 [Pseudomonas sp. IT-P218]